MLRFAGLLALAILLAACGGGPVRKVHPSTASIQQLAVQPDGSWRLLLRIQNYSTFSMHFTRIQAALTIDGKDVGTFDAAPEIDIVGSSGDVVEVAFRPSMGVRFGTEIAYALKGTIDTRDPDENFKFETASRLTPVPGVADTWR
jgi:hypothetical protein